MKVTFWIVHSPVKWTPIDTVGAWYLRLSGQAILWPHPINLLQDLGDIFRQDSTLGPWPPDLESKLAAGPFELLGQGPFGPKGLL